MRSHKRRHRKSKYRFILIFSIFLITALLIGFTTFKLNINNPFHYIITFAENINLISIDNDIVENTTKVILSDKQIDAEILLEREEIYMDIEAVKQHIYPYIEVDRENNLAYVEVVDNDVIFDNISLKDFMKEDTIVLNFALKNIENTFYLPVYSLENIFSIDVNYLHDRNVLLLDKFTDEFLTGKALKNTFLKEEPKSFSRNIAGLSEGNDFNIYGEIHDYYVVRSHDGFIGYVNKSDTAISSHMDTIISHDGTLQANDDTWQPPQQIGLVWDYMNSRSPNRSQEEKIPVLDIISPTWFRMTKGDGTIMNIGDYSYAIDAKDKGYQIWGLVTNSFDPDLSSEFLASNDAQDNFIRQIIMYSSIYGLDGINIDFENIHYRDKDAFTGFMRKLTDKLHQQNLIVSVDITIPSTSPNWSMVYDREKLGQIVDYVAVMTYDEHWASSPVSGSVASINWVERGVQRTLDSIPAEKVLLGLPFYTRLWEEERQPNGTIKVSSRAYGMEAIMSILEENNAEITWDERTGQYYSEYENDGKTYKVWLEEDRSLSLKTSLIEKYNLAGFAVWRKDFAREDVWDTLYEAVNTPSSPYN